VAAGLDDAARCAQENVGHLGFLLQLCELELLDRERRAAERRLKAAKFPGPKTLDIGRSVFRPPAATLSVRPLQTVQKASGPFDRGYEQLEKALPQQAYMGIDETGHPERGRHLWSWCFHVPGEDRFTWFHIDRSRGSKVLKRYLGTAFRGIIGCDCDAAYRKFLRETHVWLQWCWAHLIRDVRYLTTLSDPVTQRYGRRRGWRPRCGVEVLPASARLPRSAHGAAQSGLGSGR